MRCQQPCVAVLACFACGQSSAGAGGTAGASDGDKDSIADSGSASSASEGSSDTPPGTSSTGTGGVTTATGSNASSSTSGSNTTTPSAASGYNSTGPWPDPDVYQCPKNWGPTASVSGMTPFGQFSGRYAWYGHHYSDGCTVDMPDEFFVNIYASVPDGSITRFKPGPEGNFYFRFGIDYDAMSGSWVADPLPTPWQVGFIPPGGDATDVVPVEAELTVEEPLACPPPEPAGNVDPYPYIRGELRITGPGWTIEGPFLAPYCLHLSG